MTKLIHRMTAEKILEYVDAEVESSRRIDIESLATYSGYSRRHLHRLFLAETGVGLGEFKRATGMTPKEYREKTEWVFFPLSGSRRRMYDIPSPEAVWLPGSTVTGEEVVFYGTVDNLPDNPTIDAYLARIFGAEAQPQGELWMVTHATPVEDKLYHYRTVCGIGHPDGREGEVFEYSAGKYLKVEFESTRETHIERTHHIYLNILPEMQVVRRASEEVMVLRYEGGKVMCTLYIPVGEMSD